MLTPENGWRQVDFHGNAREWFGIWIINVCAMVLTLGIYSAWAKVRFKKYFYQNTYLAGRNFDYHANPVSILKARAIVVVAIAITIPLRLWFIPVLAFAILFPAALVLSARFNARNSSWANVRFNFDGRIRRAYFVYLLLPFLSIFTFGLAYPFVQRATHEFVAESHRLGNKRFVFEANAWPYYRAYLIAIGMGALGAFAMGIVAGGLVMIAASSGSLLSGQLANLDAFATIVGGYVGMGLGYAALSVCLRNVLFNNLELVSPGRVHRFRSTAKIWPTIWLLSSGLIAVVFSLGLLLPWARIRYYRYMAAHTFVRVDGDLDDIEGDLQGDQNALGDAYGDVEGFDLGLGI